MAFKPNSGDTIAIIKTNHGTMSALLHTKEVPETTKNFIELAKAGKYDGTTFHRVIQDFMIQGGDFENGNGTGGYSYKGPGTLLEDEFDPSLKNIKGALSMANRGPNTGGSQFFIVQAEETTWLDGKHAVFGYVYKGKDVLDEIAAVETGYADKPLEDVVVESIKIDTY
ncbi:peptidylprolyl isomerase [Candidatus Peregrinibacteria bacterium CG10_big_fil_rev_8_21_14_0_10_36_19]|nr:MAG: peptidylprolyl isomerase [Candidatus Peregrinibacteria bacterium CG10_big_fil_rev_8_21_14_0_10_36_19]